jgi:hypothetical protein
MTQQPDAMRLADKLEDVALNAYVIEPAVAELRRLQSVETESKERRHLLEGALIRELEINAQLLEALESLVGHEDARSRSVFVVDNRFAFTKARAAIAAARGQG